MTLRTVTLRHYRNLEDETLEFGAGANLFVGDNGQGKTNILEAIRFVSSGRSFRTSKTEHLIQRGFQKAFLQLSLSDQQREDTIELTLSSAEKLILLNQKKISQPKLSEILSKLPKFNYVGEDPDNVLLKNYTLA